MKKYFFVSDIHSFCTALTVSLYKNGFDKENPEHILVVLGDIFDRGKETLEVYNFLRSLPDERLILIRGNHESLYLSLLDKSFPETYDFSNGTVRTFCAIAGVSEKVLTWQYWYKKFIADGTVEIHSAYDMMHKQWEEIVTAVKESPVTEWLKSDKWINYFETPRYICVHSYIPLQAKADTFKWNIEYTGYREDWRNATPTEWEDATWGCPWSFAKEKWNKTGKMIMCGHWHTSDFFNHLTKQHKELYDCPIFISKRYKLVGLDACTARSNKVNVLVLTEEEI